MNPFGHPDTFSTHKNFLAPGDIFASEFCERVDTSSIRDRCFPDDIYRNNSILRHQYLMENVEDELPKFYFPPRKDDAPFAKEILILGSCKSSNEDAESVVSQYSTRAYLTREASHEGEAANTGRPYSQVQYDCYDDLRQVEPQPVVTKRDQLPTLADIFNFKTGTFIHSDVKTASPKPTDSESTEVKSESNADVNAEVEELFIPREPTKTKQDLSKRGDVVNKTLLRSIKRYYFSEFDTTYSFSALDEKEKFAQFHELVHKYITEEMDVAKTLSAEELEQAKFFFGSMISHVHMRRGITVSKQRTQVNFVHKCLYNYSHKKLSQLMQQEGFKFIIEDFVKFGGLEVVLNSEETIERQQDLYRDAAENLLLRAQE